MKHSQQPVQSDGQPSTFGIWHVTTEGDVEGRSVKDLGSYEGHIDEIALALAGEQYYCLTFEPGKKVDIKKPEHDTATISVRIPGWSINDSEERIAFAKKLFKNRPVVVGEPNTYAGIKIHTRGSKELIKQNRLERIRAETIQSLSAEQKEALGLT